MNISPAGEKMLIGKYFKSLLRTARKETGLTLIETTIALAILGAVGVAFISGVATSITTVGIDDKRATAESIAKSQVEWIKNADYVYDATEYDPSPIPDDDDHANYSVTIVTEPLNDPDDGIQKIIVTVDYRDEEIIILESYKVDR
jgi:type II secretory pathway pseudopilin PulG